MALNALTVIGSISVPSAMAGIVCTGQQDGDFIKRTFHALDVWQQDSPTYGKQSMPSSQDCVVLKKVLMQSTDVVI